MNPEIKAEWVKRLRDGREQTKGVLARLDATDDSKIVSQCCLGVLCEIAAEHGISEPTPRLGVMSYVDLQDRHVSVGVLPVSVGLWAEFRDGAVVDPRVPVPDGEVPLSQLNDNGSTFAEIADLIEKGL